MDVVIREPAPNTASMAPGVFASPAEAVHYEGLSTGYSLSDWARTQRMLLLERYEEMMLSRYAVGATLPWPGVHASGWYAQEFWANAQLEVSRPRARIARGEILDLQRTRQRWVRRRPWT